MSGIASVLPVLRWSGPDEDAREAAVRNWKRVIQITVDLGVNVINTEFSGRPERAEESERAFFRSMEELLPIFEREGIDVRIDPHPDDFVETAGGAAHHPRCQLAEHRHGLRRLPHLHMGGDMTEIIRAAGDRLRLVHVADTMDHRRSHGLRYITNPPGNPARVHQHLKIGDGDINWDEFFGGLAEIGFYDRPDTVMVSSVFAEDENAHEVSRYQLATMTDYLTKYRSAKPELTQIRGDSPQAETACAVAGGAAVLDTEAPRGRRATSTAPPRISGVSRASHERRFAHEVLDQVRDDGRAAAVLMDEISRQRQVPAPRNAVVRAAQQEVLQHRRVSLGHAVRERQSVSAPLLFRYSHCRSWSGRYANPCSAAVVFTTSLNSALACAAGDPRSCPSTGSDTSAICASVSARSRSDDRGEVFAVLA